MISCKDEYSGGCHETVTQVALCSDMASECGGDIVPYKSDPVVFAADALSANENIAKTLIEYEWIFLITLFRVFI